MTKHVHKAGMTYYQHPAYNEYGDMGPMHIFAAWDSVTNQGKQVLVAGYDKKCPAAHKPIQAGTEFVIPGEVGKLAKAGSKLGKARMEVELAMADAKRTGLAALAVGVSEVDVAMSLGVDRMTVRKWQGKR